MPEPLIPPPAPPAPPDAAERSRALDPTRSFLVQAPAGSGKTHLLTQRFLRLLGQAGRPDEIVAITFTNAAAAEMRHRILAELEKAASILIEAGTRNAPSDDPESLPELARLAIERSSLLGWQILDQPNQLRITTIDSFCRSLALQSPLRWGSLTGLGGRLDPVDNPEDLYRQAAQRTLGLLDGPDTPARKSVEELLRWRDNNWKDLEDLIVQMLGVRNRWYQEFVFLQENDWEGLRAALEAPFLRSARIKLKRLGGLLDQLPESREYALQLARFACANGGPAVPSGLAERAELPASPEDDESVDPALTQDAVEAYRDLANFLLTKDGGWRKKWGLKVNHGFPATPHGKAGKERFSDFVEGLAQEPGLYEALAAFQAPVPLRYEDAEWELIRNCFAVLRAAFGQLQLVFAETGSVDFTEVARIALEILSPENGFPSDFAMRQADSIRHLLIDEFQDTSRNQHQLISRLIGAWPQREGRSCFCVGDPMQSIYGFREAEVELFERLRTHGLEVSPPDPDSPVFRFEFVSLRANFRTVPTLVNDLNGHFAQIFAHDDGSGVRFSEAEPARNSDSSATTELHLSFTRAGAAASPEGDPEITRRQQLAEIVSFIQQRLQAFAPFNSGQQKHRIAVLGRTRKPLLLIAEALRAAGIGFRAIELVKLNERPEVLDALSLARALLNPVDRTAWLGVLRAPWCGLSLAELHLLTSADDAEICATPVPKLLATRLPALAASGDLDTRAVAAASRVAHVLRSAVEERASAAGVALGTWLESVWKALGGHATVDAAQRENLRALWNSLDRLTQGDLDLLGPGLDAALDRLFALPDPAASSDFGVQLMTIHKSKGLEFEVVIVPDLEAESKKTDHSLLSWLERGLSDPGPNGRLTEFLIAPIPPKGAKPSAAKKWVDGVKHQRQTQELRRVLYVAATRARDELHLFARPRFTAKTGPGGHIERNLRKPAGLMATAWPALGDATEAQFAAWSHRLAATQSPSPAEVAGLAAAADASTNLLQMQSPTQPAPLRPIRPTMLKRLPQDFTPPAAARPAGTAPGAIHLEDNSEPLYARTEGGLSSRLAGTAIHALLEKTCHLRLTLTTENAAAALHDALPGIVATMRAQGLALPAAEKLASEALAVARKAAADPWGAWILAPHSNAITEARWTGVLAGEQHNLRPDRVFLAPPRDAVGPASQPVWWIVDYKSSHASGVNLADPENRESFLRRHRQQHSGQLALYAHLLRSLQGDAALAVRTGLYYPRLGLFDCWKG